MTYSEYQVALVEGLVVGHTETQRKAIRPSLGPEPARHFVDSMHEKKHKKCVVCAQDRADWHKGSRIRTWCSECGVALGAIGCLKRYHTLQS